MRIVKLHIYERNGMAACGFTQNWAEKPFEIIIVNPYYSNEYCVDMYQSWLILGCPICEECQTIVDDVLLRLDTVTRRGLYA